MKKRGFIKQNFIYLVILFSLVSFCIQRIFFFSNFGLIESIVSRITYPIVLVQGKFSNLVDSYYQKKESIENLKKMLETTNKEKEDLLFDNIRMKASIGYLENISELVEFKKRFNKDSVITAQIIEKRISDEGHYCFIDKGYSSGVIKDMVGVYKNCLIGRVIEVYPNYSKIVYITDKSSKVSAYCFKTSAKGIYEGLNDLNFAELKYVNHLDNLTQHDLVLSSGEGLIYPQGFVLGRISQFTKNEIQYFVKVNLVIDVSTIKYCQLIKK